MSKVIIVGGGPVGLSTAICLANHGIESTLIEKHPTTTNHPKARGINGRSMELLRLWGVEKTLKQYQMPRSAYRFTWLEDLQGKEITQVPATVDYSPFSPSENAIIAQDDLERELLKKAQKMPQIEIRFNTEMLSAAQSTDEVTLEVFDKESDRKEVLTSQYLIAADGANSPLRKVFNVEMEGANDLGSFCNIYCEMDLDKYVEDRPSAGFMFARPDILGTFMLSKYDHRKWLMGVKLDPERGINKDIFTDEYCVEYVKKVINDPTVKVKLINKAFWTMAALIAKAYRTGRVFFAGDSAHRLPPTGGFGMNTGIQDAHNLAWKLAMVINGQAKDSLLDTYFTERSQIAQTNTQWSASNARRFVKIFTALATGDIPTFKESLADQTHHINNILLDLGFVYGSDYQNQKDYKPSAQVGARAPHLWLQKGDKELSTIDLFFNDFTLLCSPEAKNWQDKFATFPCKTHTVGKNGDYLDLNGDFLEKYEISELGAVLVRPDGHIAWRSANEKEPMPNFSWLC